MNNTPHIEPGAFSRSECVSLEAAQAIIIRICAQLRLGRLTVSSRKRRTDWSSRITFGQYWAHSQHIRLYHDNVADNAYPLVTVLHELAHHYDVIMYNHAGHDATFNQCFEVILDTYTQGGI